MRHLKRTNCGHITPAKAHHLLKLTTKKCAVTWIRKSRDERSRVTTLICHYLTIATSNSTSVCANKNSFKHSYINIVKVTLIILGKVSLAKRIKGVNPILAQSSSSFAALLYASINRTCWKKLGDLLFSSTPFIKLVLIIKLFRVTVNSYF